MKPRNRRLVLILVALAGLAGATALVLTALEENIVFFHSPSDIASGGAETGRDLRVGGLVAEGSVRPLENGPGARFTITDLSESVEVVYAGILPDLFREGQGVIAEGQLGTDGVFVAREVLARHDENYMPPEVAEALREAGQWQGEDRE